MFFVRESDGTENVLSGSLLSMLYTCLCTDCFAISYVAVCVCQSLCHSFYTCNLIVQEVSLLFMIWLFRKRLYVIMFFNE